MARGFLAGIFMGGVFSVAVAGVASFVVPISAPPQISDASPQDIDSTEPSRAIALVPAQDDSQPQTDAGASVEAPADDSIAKVATQETTAPLAAPQTAQDVTIAPLAEVTENGSPEMTADEPVFPNPMALAPMEPQGPDAVTIETQPAEPAQAEPAEDTAAVANEPPQPVPAPQVVQEAETEVEAEVAQEDAPEPLNIIADPVTPPATEDQEPATVTTATPLGSERDTGVRVNRLPTALSSAQPSEPQQLSVSARAITRYAQPFANADDKPLMSILLIDQGSDLDGGEVGIAALRSFPYALSFAVDVTLPDAAERMEIYRNEGFEVMAMVDLPEGAEPPDAETSLGVALTLMPEVVGILEGQGAGLQPNRDVADQVTGILMQGGYGLVTQDKGLNTMPKLAVKEGVPAAPIFRDFDSKDQTPTVIRRFLDQAAFKAGVEGSVIMLGRMRPETISALLVWGLQDRASQVALAPISAVLLAAEAE